MGKQVATTQAVQMVSSTQLVSNLLTELLLEDLMSEGGQVTGPNGEHGAFAAIACDSGSGTISCTRSNANGANMGYLSHSLVDNFRMNITGLVTLVDQAFLTLYMLLQPLEIIG